MNFSRIGLLILSVTLVACANHEPKPPKTQEFFTTLVKPDGTKQFSYALIVEVPDRERRGGPGGSGGHGGHHKGAHGEHGADNKHGDTEGLEDDHINYMFNEGLNAKLSDTGFCRQGYKQLDRSSRMGAIQISGECNDAANESDKQKFPNPPPKKIKVETIE